MMLIIGRHGETQFNKEDRYQGLTDSPLTEKGVEQAKKLGSFINNLFTPDIYYVSPMKRAQETLRISTNGVHLKSEIVPAMSEICYGTFEGKTKEELQRLPEWTEREQRRFTYRFPGEYNGTQGESYQTLYDRLVPFWENLDMVNKNIVVIAHLGVLIAAKKYFTKLSDEEMNEYRPTQSTVLIVENQANMTEKIL